MAEKIKTNAIRLLENAGLVFTAHEYDVSDGEIDAQSIARKLGVSDEQVFKTLVAESPDKQHFVFVVPAAGSLNLKKAAKAAGDKNMELIHVKELLGLTGYIRGGCSPVGMKKKYPTYFDETCELYDEIAVSAGARGHQMILSPEALPDFRRCRRESRRPR